MKTPTFILGTQYFRPPFPPEACWEDDIKAMRDAGLNAVQLWLVWGWCEPEPGRFVFDDYDRIADLAGEQGLGVVLSTLPEINPFWLPREHPEGQMIDVTGTPVISVNRGECISGLVPGSCSDVPIIHELMTRFLDTCGRHFGPRENLLAWDCWNENRWRNFAPDMVCFCPDSIRAFHAFMKAKYGSLEALSEAWGRRYCSWDDVRVGRPMGDSYPELHDFTNWMCHWAREMAQWRTDTLKKADPDHPVSNHTGSLTIDGGVNLNENIFSRGIDWDIAVGDTYGFSSFPLCGAIRKDMTPVDFWMRTNAHQSIGKPIWMSELQGGPTAAGGTHGPPLPGSMLQAWIWTGISRGCRAAILWCWRAEVFGGESNGYGFTAADGEAASRAEAMQRTATVIDEHAGALAHYRPDQPEIGVLFQRRSYFLTWTRGNSHRPKPHVGPDRLLGYVKALERANLPYHVYDDRHLEAIPPEIKLMIVPMPLGLDDPAAAWLAEFARKGGTVFIEGGAGCYGQDTFFRSVGERPFANAVGIREELHRRAAAGERALPAGSVGNKEPIRILPEEIDVTFAADQDGALALGPDDACLLVNRPLGRGRVIALGTFIGARMESEAPEEMNRLVESLAASAAVRRPVRCATDGDGWCTCRLGSAGGARLIMVVNYEHAQSVSLTVEDGILPGDATVTDWFGHALDITPAEGGRSLSLELGDFDQAVLEWE